MSVDAPYSLPEGAHATLEVAVGDGVVRVVVRSPAVSGAAPIVTVEGKGCGALVFGPEPHQGMVISK